MSVCNLISSSLCGNKITSNEWAHKAVVKGSPTDCKSFGQRRLDPRKNKLDNKHKSFITRVAIISMRCGRKINNLPDRKNTNSLGYS